MIYDNKYMKMALNEAKKAYVKDEVPVGAVIVKDNKVISKAHNLREIKNNAICHAELLAIDKACKKLNTWRLEDTTIYITLEPCMMCAGAIIQSRISNVVIGALDDKNGCIVSIAKLFDINTTHKVKYITNVMDNECSYILKDFFKILRSKKLK
ncbi:MAG: nucleoside deaminase [Clostridia bacterium]